MNNNNAVGVCDFKGTNIQKPFEKMRANAIITAKNNETGLSLINFNITAFLSRSRHEDAYYILSQWAIYPIGEQHEKFMAYPQEGINALKQRVELLIKNFASRSDMTAEFLENMRSRSFSAIHNEIDVLVRITKSA